MGCLSMPRIDVVDEGIIDANPSAVYEALFDEFEGTTHWWMPHWEAKPRGGVPFRQLGGVIDITVHGGSTPRFAGRSVENVKDKTSMYWLGIPEIGSKPW